MNSGTICNTRVHGTGVVSQGDDAQKNGPFDQSLDHGTRNLCPGSRLDHDILKEKFFFHSWAGYCDGDVFLLLPRSHIKPLLAVKEDLQKVGEVMSRLIRMERMCRKYQMFV